MIGAVVGVQPFGGEGLSGTGPKAGGPHYLPRLVQPRGSHPQPIVLPASAALPGPTGESNTLTLRPRGRVACIADDEAALRAQVRLALACGNTALLSRSALAERVAGDLGGRCRIVPDALAAAPDAVLFDGTEARALAIRQTLAASDGPIVPVLYVALDGEGDPMRLVRECTLTINTTASGGNATLLSLAE